MRTEDDLRSALSSLERLAPDSQELLAAVTAVTAGESRRRHRWPRAPLARSQRPGTRMAWLAGIGALVTAGAVAAAVIIPGGRGQPGPIRLHRLAGVVTSAPAGAGGARQILLTAARDVSRSMPQPSGRYWISSGHIGNYIRVGPAGDPYLILEKSLRQTWTARPPRQGTEMYSQTLGVELASAADRAAWRRDGSPASWAYSQEETFAEPYGLSSGGTDRITTARGPLVNEFGDSGGADPTKGQPASPRRLKAILMRTYPGRRDAGGLSASSWIFEMTPQLFELPTSAAVRAALYQVLAGLPGVTSLGQVRDVAGRTGVAVALSSHLTRCGGEYKLGLDAPLRLFPACVVQQRMVIDPQTGQPLSQELRYVELPVGQSWSAPGGLFSYELFGPGHWTGKSLPASH